MPRLPSHSPTSRRKTRSSLSRWWHNVSHRLQPERWLPLHYSVSSATTSDNQVAKDETKELDSLIIKDIEKQQQQHQGLDSLRRLVAFSQPEHRLIGWSAATLLITSSTTLIFPMASGKVLDMILNGDRAVSPTLVAAVLFGVTVVAGVGVYARTLWLQQAGNTMVARLKHCLYQSILRQEVAYLDKMKTGDLMTRLSQDTQLIQSAVTMQAVSALRASVMLMGSTLMLFQTSAILALVSLATYHLYSQVHVVWDKNFGTSNVMSKHYIVMPHQLPKKD